MNSVKRPLIGGALLLAFLLATGVANSDTVILGSEQIEFNPGIEYCALNASASPHDRYSIEYQEKVNAGKNKVLGMFVLCDRIERLRTGEETNIGQYGVLLSPLDKNGNVSKVNYSRSRWIEEISKVFDRGIDLKAQDLSTRLNEALDPLIAEQTGGINLGGLRQLGVLHTDDAAVYSGMLMQYQVEGMDFQISGVSANTLVRRYPIQYSLYAEFVDKNTYKGLVDDLKPVMAGLITQNETFEERSADLPQTTGTDGSILDSMLGKGIAGGVFGAFVGLVYYLARRIWNLTTKQGRSHNAPE